MSPIGFKSRVGSALFAIAEANVMSSFLRSTSGATNTPTAGQSTLWGGHVKSDSSYIATYWWSPQGICAALLYVSAVPCQPALFS